MLVLAYVTWRGGFHTIWKVRWWLRVVRGVLGIGILSMFALGVRRRVLRPDRDHRSLPRERRSAVAPFEYTALAWGVALDWLLWKALPNRYTILGAAMIVASEAISHGARAHVELEHP